MFSLYDYKDTITSPITSPITQVQEFIELVSSSESVYGFCSDTLNSLVLSLLPTVDHIYNEIAEPSLVDNFQDIRFYILREIVQALREFTGLFVPKVQARVAILRFLSQNAFKMCLVA